MTDAPAKDRSETRNKGLRSAMLIFLGTLAFAAVATGLVIASTDDIGSGSPEGNLQGQSNDTGSGSGTGGASLEGNDDAASAGGSSAATQGSSVTAQLTAGGFDLLGADARVEDVVGEDAEGRGVKVQQVVPGEGFFIGESAENTVYVEFGGDVGEDETNELPQQGDTVDLTGPVRPAPEDPRQTLRLDAEQARQVEDDGFFVNADRVVPAAG